MVHGSDANGKGHFTRPYVDLLCTDSYTLTLTVPVRANGINVGVADADVLVETIELLLMDRLRDIGPRATLVNGIGRGIVSADPQLAAGKFLVRGWQDAPDTARRAAGSGFGFDKFVLRPCGSLPLGIALPA